MLSVRTIVHPTDFSMYSQRAFQLAYALARDYRARLMVLHARELPAAVYGEFGAVAPTPADTPDQLREKLDELKPADSAVQIERRLIDGDPATVILHAARDTSCDLIVMGTHGRTGLGCLLMGSVAEHVVRKAPCAVLTVKAPSLDSAPVIRTTVEQPANV